MGKFLQLPQLVKVSEPAIGRTSWRLETDLVYQDSKGRRWIVPAGYVTDFASVPHTPLMSWLFRDHAQMAATLHDRLCTDYFPKLMSWREAADLFHEAMLDEGVSKWRAAAMRWGVLFHGVTKKEEE